MIRLLFSHQFVDTVHQKETGAQLAGSWTVEVGDQDEAGRESIIELQI